MSKRIWAAQRRRQSNSSRKYVLLFVALLRVWNMDGPTGPTSTSYKIIDPEDFTVAEPFSTNFHCVRPPVAQGPIDIISDGQGCTNWTAPIDTSVQPRFCALQQCYNLVVAPASCIVQRSVAWVLGSRPMWRCFRHHTQCLAGISRAILKKVLIIIIVIYMILV